MGKATKRIHIGTSGWSYPHWQGPFYPMELPDDQWLAYYADRFHTVEINNSFYHLPSENTLAHWRDTVSENFIFTAKGSRYITHMKKLKDPEKSVPPLLERLGVLGDALGPVLFQLPPRWHRNVDRLQGFLEELPADLACAFEFRDETWYDDAVYDLLRQHAAAFCIYELDGHVSPLQVTADLVYVRLHGPDGAYQGSYSTKTLERWAERFSDWAQDGKDVYCYFDNDEAGYAAHNALKLEQLVHER